MPALTTIKLRRGTAAAWTAANPTLAAGEPGLETDTGKWKWGDGATAWASLGYVGGGATGFGTPALTLGTAAAAGSATTGIRTDATIVAFDGTNPVSQALGDAAATGSAGVAARRDHKHGMPALSTATPLVESGSGATGTGTLSSREDHVHPAGGGSSDHKVMVSSGDTTADYLLAKLAAGTNVTLTKLNAGANEQVSIAASGGGGSGALTLLEQHTASASATLDFTTAISSTYDDYLIEFVNILPATNGANFLMRMGTGGGPTWDAGTNYGSGSWEWQVGGGAAGGADAGQAAIAFTRNGIANGASTWALSGRIQLVSLSAGGKYTEVNGIVVYPYGSSSLRISSTMFGNYQSTTAVTGVRFLMSSGNIASGTVRVYGLSK